MKNASGEIIKIFLLTVAILIGIGCLTLGILWCGHRLGSLQNEKAELKVQTKTGGKLIPIELPSNNLDFESWNNGDVFVNPSSDGTELADNWKNSWFGAACPVLSAGKDRSKLPADQV